MMIDCLIAFKNISLITWRQQAERDIFYEAQRALSIATQDGVVSKFLLKNNLATFATSDKKWNTLAIVAEGPIFAIYIAHIVHRFIVNMGCILQELTPKS